MYSIIEGTQESYKSGVIPGDEFLDGRTVSTYLCVMGGGVVEVTQFYRDDDGIKRRRDFAGVIKLFQDVVATERIDIEEYHKFVWGNHSAVV